MATILDFNEALTEKELAEYLGTEFDPQQRDKVLAGLTASIEAFVVWLFPSAIITPKKALVGDIHGSPGGSLVIQTSGAKAGVWSDFADPAQKGGNLIDLYIAAKGVSFKNAIKDLSDWVGHGTRPDVQYSRERLARKAKRVQRDLGPQKGEWHYSDADGTIIASVYRYEPEEGGKEFLPWDALKRQYGNPDIRPLYNIPGILKTEEIVFCEGEKAADALIKQGICATAVMGGANSPLDRSDLSPLKGKKVTIWPDADEPGAKFAANLAMALNELCDVSIIETPTDAEKGWDAADATIDEIKALLATGKAPDEADFLAGSPFAPKMFDPASLLNIPKREWLVGNRFQAGKVTGGVAPGGVGKSLFSLATAIAICTGDGRLTGEKIYQKGCALVIYNEEDEDEVHRRIAGICKHWSIDPNRLAGKLHTMCSVSGEVKVLTMDRTGTTVAMPEVALITEYCKRHNISYLACDPFITFHNIQENDNTNIDAAARQFSKIAKDANVAIDLIHHVSKGADSEDHAGDIARARGASSIVGAIRNSYTLASMSKKTAKKYNISMEEHVRFVRLDDGKKNYALRGGEPTWFRLASVDLDNGDQVGVHHLHDFSAEQSRLAEESMEQENLAREEALVAIHELLNGPEIGLKVVAETIASRADRTERWARNMIQNLIPMAPDYVSIRGENGVDKLQIMRANPYPTAPLLIVKIEEKL